LAPPVTLAVIASTAAIVSASPASISARTVRTECRIVRVIAVADLLADEHETAAGGPMGDVGSDLPTADEGLRPHVREQRRSLDLEVCGRHLDDVADGNAAGHCLKERRESRRFRPRLRWR
jgi:hypothetical protein